jgi:tetratricopeptide (TPR) repeat protein
MLAKLYLNQDDWKKAAEVLRNLAEDYPEDPRCRTTYIRELLKHNELGEAENNLEKLAITWPTLAETVSLRAECLLRRGKADDALDSLKKYIDDVDGSSGERLKRMRSAALSLEEFAGRPKLVEAVDRSRMLDAAEMYLRQYADAHPSATCSKKIGAAALRSPSAKPVSKLPKTAAARRKTTNGCASFYIGLDLILTTIRRLRSRWVTFIPPWANTPKRKNISATC